MYILLTEEQEKAMEREKHYQEIEIDPLAGRVRWERENGRLVVHIDRKRERVRFEDESEDSVTLIVEPKTNVQ